MPVFFDIRLCCSVATVTIETTRYSNGDLAVHLFTEDAKYIATLSMQVEEARLAPGEFIFKTYAENEGFLEQLVAFDVVQDTGRRVAVAWRKVPVCRLTVPLRS